MTITQFEISTDKTQIDITITDAATVSSLNIWNSNTYKDYTLATDITSKLSAQATEVLTVSLSDLGISEFDGVYILEAIDPDEVEIVLTQELSRYKECILERVLELFICDDCLEELSIPINNAQSLLVSLEHAIELSFINEVINLVKALDTYCTNDCKSCGSYTNSLNNN